MKFKTNKKENETLKNLKIENNKKKTKNLKIQTIKN